MITQEDFNTFVATYNDDYLLVLRRAATGSFDCLLTSFSILRDLYDMISTLHDVQRMRYEIVPYPFTIRGNTELFKSLGFGDEETSNIAGFLDYVKANVGKEFEEWILDKNATICNPSR